MIKHSSKYIIILTFVIWGLLDIFLLLIYGNAATESATIWRWSFLLPSFTFSIGNVMGHFFGQDRAPSPQSVPTPLCQLVGEVITLTIMALWLSLDGISLVFHGHPLYIDNMIWNFVYHQVWIVFFIGFGTGSFFLRMNRPTSF